MSRLPEMVVWLDPGLTTGWARYGNDTMFSDQADFFTCGVSIESLCVLYGPNLWVGWERYLVTQGGGKAGTPEYSLETIGMLKWLARKHGCRTLKPMPAASRELGDDGKLKRLGWYVPGQRHANDAANHLLAWLLREHVAPGHVTDRLFTD